MVFGGQGASFSVCCKSQETWLVCKEGGKVGYERVAKVFELASESFKAKHDDTTLAKSIVDVQA